MKTFTDLEFNPHPSGDQFGISARTTFDNGYGISVVKGPHTYGGDIGLYEAAVLDSDGKLCYTTPLTQDVIGYLREEDVTDTMIQIQKLQSTPITTTFGKGIESDFSEGDYFA